MSGGSGITTRAKEFLFALFLASVFCYFLAYAFEYELKIKHGFYYGTAIGLVFVIIISLFVGKKKTKTGQDR